MTDQEKQKLNEKLAKWAGFELKDNPYYSTEKVSDGEGGFCLEQVKYQSYWNENGLAYPKLPDFTDSLNACFKWLVPTFIKTFHNNELALDLLISDWREQIKHASQFADISFYAEQFCLATERLIGTKQDLPPCIVNPENLTTEEVDPTGWIKEK